MLTGVSLLCILLYAGCLTTEQPLTTKVLESKSCGFHGGPYFLCQLSFANYRLWVMGWRATFIRKTIREDASVDSCQIK